MVPVTTAAVVLAAGAGRRFGPQPKLLAELHGAPLLAHSLGAATAAGADEVVVVLGANAESIAPCLPTGVTPLHNDAWRAGLASSLRCAVDHARTSGHDALVVGLGDQPQLRPEAWQAVLGCDAPIAVATYGARRGPPVRLDVSVWDLLDTTGDAGARTLIATRPELVLEVPCAGDPSDVDTVGDLQRLRYGAGSIARDDAEEHPWS